MPSAADALRSLRPSNSCTPQMHARSDRITAEYTAEIKQSEQIQRRLERQTADDYNTTARLQVQQSIHSRNNQRSVRLKTQLKSDDNTKRQTQPANRQQQSNHRTTTIPLNPPACTSSTSHTSTQPHSIGRAERGRRRRRGYSRAAQHSNRHTAGHSSHQQVMLRWSMSAGCVVVVVVVAVVQQLLLLLLVL